MTTLDLTTDARQPVPGIAGAELQITAGADRGRVRAEAYLDEFPVCFGCHRQRKRAAATALFALGYELHSRGRDDDAVLARQMCVALGGVPRREVS